MPEADVAKQAKKFYEDVPMKTEGFFSQRSRCSWLGDEESAVKDI